MKKGLYLVIGMLLVLFALPLLIPRIQEKTISLPVACPPNAIGRFITSAEKWESWWPGKRISGDSIWQIEEKQFRITQRLLNGFQAMSEDQTVAIDLQFHPAVSNESIFTIRTTYALPFHPVYRLWALFIKSKAEAISEALQKSCHAFFSQPLKVYGIDIRKGKVKYFSWISTKEKFDHSPSAEELYRTIEALTSFVDDNKGKILDKPIMHVYQETNESFELMVAVPTDRDLPSKGRFQLKNMILGSLLQAEVEGGPASVGRAINELENYVKDHRLVSPAIPFETLITDRRKETDTTKWVSIVNYPIFDQ